MQYFDDEAAHTQGRPPKGQLDPWAQVLRGDECGIMCDWPRDAPGSCRFAIPTTSGRIYFFYSHSAATCAEWLDAIERVLRKAT
jgi:hypothetical protein